MARYIKNMEIFKKGMKGNLPEIIKSYKKNKYLSSKNKDFLDKNWPNFDLYDDLLKSSYEILKFIENVNVEYIEDFIVDTFDSISYTYEVSLKYYISFGNGERIYVDIKTDITQDDLIIEFLEKISELKSPKRHPYLNYIIDKDRINICPILSIQYKHRYYDDYYNDYDNDPIIKSNYIITYHRFRDIDQNILSTTELSELINKRISIMLKYFGYNNITNTNQYASHILIDSTDICLSGNIQIFVK